MKNIFFLFAGLSVAFTGIFLSGCSKHKDPNFVYMPDMAYSPAIKAQEPGSMRMPPKGSVPREITGPKVPNDPEEAARVLKNPLTRSKAVMKKGQEYFGYYCKVCHGPEGLGNGPVTPRFPPPPSLVSEKVRKYTDGKIYYIISHGQNLMPSYASQVLPEERWAIIHFIRALDRSQNPSDSDMKKAENW